MSRRLRRALVEEPKPFEHPVMSELHRLGRLYFGLRNIPEADLKTAAASKACKIYRAGGRLIILPLKQETMERFYKEHSFKTKMVGGKKVFVPPDGGWTPELQRAAIRYCVEVVLRKKPFDCTTTEFRCHISGIFADFSQSKTAMLKFAGYSNHEI